MSFWTSQEYIQFHKRLFLELKNKSLIKNGVITKRSQILYNIRKKYELHILEFFRKGNSWIEMGISARIIQTKQIIRVIDIGGGGGDNYFNLRNYISKNVEMHHTIYDFPLLFCALDLERRDALYKQDSIHLIPTGSYIDEEFDLMLLNGTLQYLDSINHLFKNFQKKPKYLLVARTLFVENGLKTQQVIGIEKNDEKFGQKAILPINLYEESKLANALKDEGYELFIEFHQQPHKVSTSKGLIDGFYRTKLFRFLS